MPDGPPSDAPAPVVDVGSSFPRSVDGPTTTLANVLRRRPSEIPPPPADAAPDDLSLLAAVNRIARAIRSDLDVDGAQVLADTMLEILPADGAVVTFDGAVAASAGRLPSERDIVRATREVLDRQPGPTPTNHAVVVDGHDRYLVIAPLLIDGLVVGTIQALAIGDDDRLRALLRQLGDLVGHQVELAELEREKARVAQAELRTLQAQTSPHFLYNSLTAIAALINTDPTEARSLISTFAEFTRHTFRTTSTFTTLAEELRLVEMYLELERARFGDRMSVRLLIAPEVLAVTLPFLSVQPLVENAIRHGLEQHQGSGVLTIEAADSGAQAVITVDDDGAGTDPVALQAAMTNRTPTPHVGLLSVDERLRATFGPEYGLEIATGDGVGTRVTMRVPKFHPGVHAT